MAEPAPDPHPDPRLLAQPDRALLLDRPAQGAHPERLRLARRARGAAARVRAPLPRARRAVRLELYAPGPRARPFADRGARGQPPACRLKRSALRRRAAA